MPSARSPKPGAMIAPGCAISSSATSASVVSSSAATDAACSKRQPRHPHRVDHALLEQVAELARQRVQPVAGGHRPHLVDRRLAVVARVGGDPVQRLAQHARGRSPRRARSRRSRSARRARPPRAAARSRLPGRRPRTPPPAWPPARPRCAGSAPSSAGSVGAPTRITARFADEPRDPLLEDLDVALVDGAAELHAQLREAPGDGLGGPAAFDERAVVGGHDDPPRRAEVLAARRRSASARPPRRSRCRRRTPRGRRGAGSRRWPKPGARTATASSVRCCVLATSMPSALASTFSARITSGRGSFASTASRIGSRSFGCFNGLVGHEDERVLEDRLHPVLVAHHVRREPAVLDHHALDERDA